MCFSASGEPYVVEESSAFQPVAFLVAEGMQSLSFVENHQSQLSILIGVCFIRKVLPSDSSDFSDSGSVLPSRVSLEFFFLFLNNARRDRADKHLGKALRHAFPPHLVGNGFEIVIHSPEL